ncbi:MAG: DUF4153 domain-containing protein [Bacteroidales bacterium]|nr:DUF4153 domain-containing protein [Bacteroidales bacterium]MDD2425126.1 DUF4153 domain-containing protein [Bacteroidales bacterium]MDD3989453.1 DUF4153 domain-containing protein [Bacteroidales bacterium]MDD4638275.1 DUF4153 domain-containing protein [Bacteroidales bacterium]
MSANLKTLIRNLWVVVLQNPVEIAVSLTAFLVSVLMYEDVIPEYAISDNLLLAPVVFAIPYILNRIGPGKILFKILYLLSIFCALFFFCRSNSNFSETFMFPALIIITLAAVSAFRNTRDNILFFKSFLKFWKNLIFALISAGAGALLLMALSTSVTYLFDLFREFSSNINFYIANVAMFIGAPVVFLYLDYEWEPGMNKIRAFNISGISDILINYLLSPALILYTVILYVYIDYIALTWSLPKGNVAVMVTAFVVISFLVRGLLPILERQNFKQFYRYLGYISVIPLILFWTGAIYRVNQYGFTEARVYLLVTGAIMTYTVITFLKESTASYLRIGYAIVVAGLIFTFVPWMSAGDTGIRSQQNRLDKTLSESGLSPVNGKIPLTGREVSTIDSVKLEQICDILDYLEKYSGSKITADKYGFFNGKEFKKASGGDIQLTK